jgi:Holliday junction resolvase RusA-like endonuclease
MPNASVKVFIKGNPRTKPSKSKTLPEWTLQVVEQTKHLPIIDGPCKVVVKFRLNQEEFDKSPPYGSDLDNLLKALIDALKETVLSPDDQRVVAIRAKKTPPNKAGASGAYVKIRRAKGWPASP